MDTSIPICQAGKRNRNIADCIGLVAGHDIDVGEDHHGADRQGQQPEAHGQEPAGGQPEASRLSAPPTRLPTLSGEREAELLAGVALRR